MNPRTILIADKEPQYVSLIRKRLEQEGYTIVWAKDKAETLAQLSHKPEVLLLDLKHDDTQGFDLFRQLRSIPEGKSLPIIMLSNKKDESEELLGLELGADDFLTKSISPRLLSARIKNVLKRYNISTSEEVTRLQVKDLEIDRSTHTVKLGEKEIFLPRKEFELLWILSTSIGKVFSREMLLRRVWGENIYVTDRTVDVHICKVRQRLGEFGDQNIETIKGVGYRLKA